VGITTSRKYIFMAVRLFRIWGRHIRLHISVVIIGDFPLTSVFYQDLQQPRAEAALLISIRSRRQLLNSSHSREDLRYGDIRTDELN
jgi:hypothetical protein